MIVTVILNFRLIDWSILGQKIFKQFMSEDNLSFPQSPQMRVLAVVVN